MIIIQILLSCCVGFIFYVMLRKISVATRCGIYLFLLSFYIDYITFRKLVEATLSLSIILIATRRIIRTLNEVKEKTKYKS